MLGLLTVFVLILLLIVAVIAKMISPPACFDEEEDCVDDTEVLTEEPVVPLLGPVFAQLPESDRKLTISEDLILGQTVWVVSNSTGPQQMTIASIENDEDDCQIGATAENDDYIAYLQYDCEYLSPSVAAKLKVPAEAWRLERITVKHAVPQLSLPDAKLINQNFLREQTCFGLFDDDVLNFATMYYFFNCGMPQDYDWYSNVDVPVDDGEDLPVDTSDIPPAVDVPSVWDNAIAVDPVPQPEALPDIAAEPTSDADLNIDPPPSYDPPAAEEPPAYDPPAPEPPPAYEPPAPEPAPSYDPPAYDPPSTDYSSSYDSSPSYDSGSSCDSPSCDFGSSDSGCCGGD